MVKSLIWYIIIVVLIVPLFWEIEGFSSLPIFKYLDEFIAIISVMYIIKKWKKLSKNEKNIVRLILCLLIVGSLSTFIYQLQTGVFPVALDAFLCVKCFLVFIFANHVVFSLSDDIKISIIKKINCLLIPFLIIAFVLSIVNLAVDVGMSDRVRHGFRCFRFLYTKSGTFSDMFRIFYIFLIPGYKIYSHKKWYVFLIFLSIIIWILTFRTRSTVYAPIFLFLFLWYIVKGKTLAIRGGVLLILAITIFTFASDKLESTYGEEDAGPRAILLYYGIKTMLTYMPIGAGFGTYGTDVACTYYSPLYYEYGFDKAYGLSPNDTRYAHDNYWPAIMGEFGVIGLILVILILFYIGKEINMHYKGNRIGMLMGSFLLGTAVLTSSAAPAFFVATYWLMLMPLTYIQRFTTIKQRKILNVL